MAAEAILFGRNFDRCKSAAQDTAALDEENIPGPHVDLKNTETGCAKVEQFGMVRATLSERNEEASTPWHTCVLSDINESTNYMNIEFPSCKLLSSFATRKRERNTQKRKHRRPAVHGICRF